MFKVDPELLQPRCPRCHAPVMLRPTPGEEQDLHCTRCIRLVRFNSKLSGQQAPQAFTLNGVPFVYDEPA